MPAKTLAAQKSIAASANGPLPAPSQDRRRDRRHHHHPVRDAQHQERRQQGHAQHLARPHPSSLLAAQPLPLERQGEAAERQGQLQRVAHPPEHVRDHHRRAEERRQQQLGQPRVVALLARQSLQITERQPGRGEERQGVQHDRPAFAEKGREGPGHQREDHRLRIGDPAVRRPVQDDLLPAARLLLLDPQPVGLGEEQVAVLVQAFDHREVGALVGDHLVERGAQRRQHHQQGRRQEGEANGEVTGVRARHAASRVGVNGERGLLS